MDHPSSRNVKQTETRPIGHHRATSSPRCRLLDLFSFPLHRHSDTPEKSQPPENPFSSANRQISHHSEISQSQSLRMPSKPGSRSTILAHLSRSHTTEKDSHPTKLVPNTLSSPYMTTGIQLPRPLHSKMQPHHPEAVSVVSILSPGCYPTERNNGSLQVTFANNTVPKGTHSDNVPSSETSPSFNKKKSRTHLHVATFSPPFSASPTAVPSPSMASSSPSASEDTTDSGPLDASSEFGRRKSGTSMTSAGSIRSSRPSQVAKRRKFSIGSFHFERADKSPEKRASSAVDISTPSPSREGKSRGTRSPPLSSRVEESIEAGWTFVYIPPTTHTAHQSRVSLDSKSSPRLSVDAPLGRAGSIHGHSRSPSLRTTSLPHFSFESARDVAISRRN